jgi:tripartite-type tricarboxylate transporter receptor subunit TctC
MIKQCIAAMTAFAWLCGAQIVYAASDDNFYKGKTIRLIVAFSPGGGYDAYSRTIGRHLGKHIPGNPSVVVENMTGAGGIIHANFQFHVPGETGWADYRQQCRGTDLATNHGGEGHRVRWKKV